jgi:hypothetical protein
VQPGGHIRTCDVNQSRVSSWNQRGLALLPSCWSYVRLTHLPHTSFDPPAALADQRKEDLQLLEAAPPDEGGGGGSRSLMPYAKDADDIDADADDDDSSSDEVGGC